MSKGFTVTDPLHIDQFDVTITNAYVSLQGEFSQWTLFGTGENPNVYKLRANYYVFGSKTRNLPSLDRGIVELSLDTEPTSGQLGLLINAVKALPIFAGKTLVDDA